MIGLGEMFLGSIQLVGEGAASGFARVGQSIMSLPGAVMRGITAFGQFVFFAKAAADGAMQFGEALLGPSAALEQETVAFTGLLGSAKAAQAMLAQLQQFAAETPFEFPGLVKDTQELLGMGFAGRDIIPVMTAIGDAAAGVGRGQEGIDRITLALGQMEARGKVTGQDMMQLTEAGIPAWRILAASMHLTVAQVQELSAKGKLGADSVTALWHGMEKMYGGQMAGQAQTFNGLLSTLQDNARLALMAFAGPLFDMAKGALQQLVALVSAPAFSAFAKTVGQQVGAGLLTLIADIKQAVQWFGQFGPQVQQVVTAFQNLGQALLPIAAPLAAGAASLLTWDNAAAVLRDVILAVAATLAGFANGLASVINWIRAGGPVIQGIETIFRTLANVIVNAVMPVWRQLQASWGDVVAAIRPLMPQITQLAQALGVGLVVAIVLLISITAGLIEAFGQVLAGVIRIVSGIIQVVSGLVQTVSGLIQFLIDLFSGRFDKLAGDLNTVMYGIVTMFVGVFNIIAGLFQATWGAISAFTQGFISTIVGLFQGLQSILVGGSIVPDMCAAMLSAFLSLFSSVIGAIGSFVGQVIGDFQNLMGQAIGAAQGLVSGVAGALSGLGSIAASAGSALINGLVGSIQAGVGWVANAIGSVVATIDNMLPHSPAKEGPLRHLDSYGPALTHGFAEGIRRGLPEVRTAATLMVAPVASSAQGAGGSGGRGGGGGRGGDSRPIIIQFSEREIVRALMPAAADEIRIHFGGR